jgi:hypothetical protein
MSMGWLLETGTAAGSAAKRYQGEMSGGGGKGCVHSHVWGDVGDGAAARGGSCVMRRGMTRSQG